MFTCSCKCMFSRVTVCRNLVSSFLPPTPGPCTNSRPRCRARTRPRRRTHDARAPRRTARGLVLVGPRRAGHTHTRHLDLHESAATSRARRPARRAAALSLPLPPGSARRSRSRGRCGTGTRVESVVRFCWPDFWLLGAGGRGRYSGAARGRTRRPRHPVLLHTCVRVI